MSNLKLTDLKKLYDEGCSIIYLRPSEKRPVEEKWTSGLKKSWGQLEKDFREYYNVGIRLGSTSLLKSGNFLGVIDCDVKSQSQKDTDEMTTCLHTLGISLGKAPTVLSGRGNGSKHVYVQTEFPMRPSTFARSDRLCKALIPSSPKPSKRDRDALTEKELEDGYRIRPCWEISFMGEGQQTVLPPSIHPDTNNPYVWDKPFKSENIPLFKPENHAGYLQRSLRDDDSTLALDFKKVEVNLKKTGLDKETIAQISTGEGVEDRSAALMSITLKMCRLGMTNHEILSVLVDEGYWISSAAFDHTQSRNEKRAVNWLWKYTLKKARHETHPMRLFENATDHTKRERTEEQAVAEKAEIEEMRAEVLPDVDGKSNPRPTLRNIVQVLEKFMGGALVGFDEFACRPYFLKDTVYGGVKGQEIKDENDLSLKHYLACHYGFEPSKELCFEAHTLIAQKYRFHPVKHYLEGLSWDGVRRLENWLRRGFKATGPDGYLDAVSVKVLCAAVARIYDPGCKFDYMMVFEGQQGEGKSFSLEGLVGMKWFADRLGDINNKDVIDQMLGKWIIEVSELKDLRGQAAEAVKAFVTRKVDRARLSYMRRAEDYPRQCIFIGSTNNKEYLSDETGNRRYWPVEIKEADREWLISNRDQLWAEAKFRYECGELLYLSKDLELIANAEQEKRFEVDVWEAEIRKKLADDTVNDFHTTTELWRAINDISGTGYPEPKDAYRIQRIMRHLKYQNKQKRVDGMVTRGWGKA